MLLTVARQTLLEARYNRLVWLALALLLLVWLLAGFLGALAITEHRAIQASVLAGLLRLIAVLLLVLFIVASVLREQQDRQLESLLTLPEPRAAYVLGKALACAVLAVLLAAVAGLALLLHASPAAVLPWAVSLACELLLAAAFGLLLAFTFRQTVAALAAFIVIYCLSRVMGALLLMLAQPTFAYRGWGQVFIEYFIGALAWLLPALYRFTEAGWLTQAGPVAGSLLYVLGQTAIYLPLLLLAAMADLYRREF